MTLWFHSTILAVSLAATVAIGIASAAIYSEAGTGTSAKTDRLPLVAASEAYVTVETRANGVSVLNRLPTTN